MSQDDYDLEREPITIQQVRRMPGYDRAKNVDENSHNISQKEFEINYRLPLRPTVIRGGVEHWPAFKLWNDIDYLKEKAGKEEVQVYKGLFLDLILKYIANNKLSDVESDKKFIKNMTFTDCIKLFSEQYAANTILYARSSTVPNHLLDDIGELPCCSETDVRTSFFLGRSSYTDIHEHAGPDAFMCQVTGTKEVILFPPDEINAKALYRISGVKWSPVRLFDVDFKKFPLFSEATPYKVTVNAGDALYIPNPWWHAVVSLDDIVTMTVACFFPPKRYDLESPQTRDMFLKKPFVSRRFCKQKHIPVPGWFELIKKSLFK